jgi:hypothetical protein
MDAEARRRAWFILHDCRHDETLCLDQLLQWRADAVAQAVRTGERDKLNNDLAHERAHTIERLEKEKIALLKALDDMVTAHSHETPGWEAGQVCVCIWCDNARAVINQMERERGH